MDFHGITSYAASCSHTNRAGSRLCAVPGECFGWDCICGQWMVQRHLTGSGGFSHAPAPKAEVANNTSGTGAAIPILNKLEDNLYFLQSC